VSCKQLASGNTLLPNIRHFEALINYYSSPIEDFYVTLLPQHHLEIVSLPNFSTPSLYVALPSREPL
jgi:hypothetical protein